jgi:AcrR family transcriptional regulator
MFRPVIRVHSADTEEFSAGMPILRYGNWVVKNADRRAQSTEKILNSTIELLGEHGFSAFRVADVAIRSGVSHGLLFRYFPTKYELFRGALQLATNRSIQAIRLAARELEAHAACYETPLQGLFWVTIQQDRWIYELIFATKYDAELLAKVEDVYRDYISALGRISEEFSKNTGMLNHADADIAIRAIGWIFHGVLMNEQARAIEPSERDRTIKWLAGLLEARYPLTKDSHA